MTWHRDSFEPCTNCMTKDAELEHARLFLRGWVQEEKSWYAIEEKLRTDIRKRDIAIEKIRSLPHADWCCTKGCSTPTGTHFGPLPEGVPISQTLMASVEYLCPGECTCDLAEVLAILADSHL